MKISITPCGRATDNSSTARRKPAVPCGFLLEFLSHSVGRTQDALTRSQFPFSHVAHIWSTGNSHPPLSPKLLVCSPILTRPLPPFLRWESLAIAYPLYPPTAGNTFLSSPCDPKEACHMGLRPPLGLWHIIRSLLRDPPRIFSLHMLTHCKYH